MKPSLLFAAPLAAVLPVAGLAASSAAVPVDGASFPVTMTVDAGHVRGELKPIWRFFGADEPNYGTMRDGRRLLTELGELRPEQVYFRAHNLLCTGDGTPALKWGSTNAYTETPDGQPVYDWTVLDRIFDTYRARHIHPYAEIGFMPKALSTHPEPYQHDWRPNFGQLATGWSYPPTDYHKWAELVYQWVTHCVQRYGRAEVERWYWEVWNEANISPYWHGTPEDFFKLHDFAVDAVRRALPTARVGGPDMAGSGGKFMHDFLAHCVTGVNYATGKVGTPVDFVSFHAKGQPKYVDGHVRLGIAAQLSGIDRGFAMIASVPQLKEKPIVIGESDPDGCAACQGAQLGYRTSPMYASYTAACIARELMLADEHDVNLEGALTWAFEFEDQPYFAGQRVLANNAIDLPILNLFRMLSKMDGQRLDVQSSAEVPLAEIVHHGVEHAPDVTALAARHGNRLEVLSWHYHDDDVTGPAAAVKLELEHLPVGDGMARVTEYRIDETHSDAFTVWKQLGSPTAPTEKQYKAIQAAGKLATMNEAPTTLSVSNGTASLSYTLPRQSVSLFVIEWP